MPQPRTLVAFTLISFATVLAPGAASATEVELIHALGADITVSSVVQNISNHRDQLVDGNMNTAWNSRTGDLVGAWIELDLRDAQTVSSLELTAGFNRTTPRVDLFTANHRIVRVRVERDGVAIGTFSLDATIRELQSLPVHGPGGVYKIIVVETRAGTRRTWREVCLSEIAAHGTVAADVHVSRSTSSVHETTVNGGQPDSRGPIGSAMGPFPTLEAFCAANRPSAEDCGSEGSRCSCNSDDPATIEGPITWSGTVASVREARVFVNRTDEAQDAQCALSVHTARGWWVFPEAFQCDLPYMAGTDGNAFVVTIDRFDVRATTAGAAELRLRRRERTSHTPADTGDGSPLIPGDTGSSSVRRREMVCTIPSEAAPTCGTDATVGAPWRE